jgi:4-amino-4-deoxychorismate lyase
MKHLNRLEQVLARAEWGEEYPEGLLLDQQGFVIEGVSSNLFCYHEGQWLTPLLTDSGVAGVMREYLMSVLLPELSVPATESRITLEQLVSSEEVFLCNSVVGIWPVVSLADRYRWPLGEHVKSIQQRLKEALPCYG